MTTRPFTPAALLIITITGAAMAGTPTKPFEAVPELQGLTARWAEGAEAFRVPGYSVAVIKDGAIIALEGFGRRDVGDDKPVTPDSMFYIASLTKTYTTMGVLALVDDGKVELDAPVKRYLPRFELADADATASITVRDLLCHKPGINSFALDFLESYTGQISEDRFYEWLSVIEPTMQVEYSNQHFTLVGRIIDAVSGKPWQEFLDERIFDPAGMFRTTTYASTMYGDADAAFPMEGSKDAWSRCAIRKSDRVMHAAGGMGTSAADGARWVMLQLNNGEIGGTRVISKEMSVESHKLQSKDPRARDPLDRIEGYGLAWFRGAYRGHGPYFEHNGDYVGARAHLSFIPGSGIGVVMLANSSPGGYALSDIVSIDIYDRLLGETGHPDLLPMFVHHAGRIFAGMDGDQTARTPVTATTLSAGLDLYVGTFTSRLWGDLSIAVEDGALTGHIGDMPITIVSTGGKDQIALSTPDGTYDTSFVISDEGSIDAVIVTIPEFDPIRFVRVPS